MAPRAVSSNRSMRNRGRTRAQACHPSPRRRPTATIVPHEISPKNFFPTFPTSITRMKHFLPIPPSLRLLIVLRRPLSGVNCYEHACGNYTEYGRPLVAARSCAQSLCEPSIERASSCPSLVESAARQFGECLTSSPTATRSLIEMFADKIARLHLQIAFISARGRSLCPLVCESRGPSRRRVRW